MFRNLALAIALVASAPAIAQSANAVSLRSDVKVERSTTDANGHVTVTLSEPSRVLPGEMLIFTINYRNNGAQPATDFVINNPLPAEVRFHSSADPQPIVSVDGGQTFGALASLTVAAADGTRHPAEAKDVTNLRWTFPQPIAAGQSGQVSFRGVVK